MSWNTTYPSRATFEADEPDFSSPARHDMSKEQLEQLTAGRAAATSLVASGSLGGEDKDLHIVLSGHANPGHEPSENFGRDALNVSITRKATPVAVEKKSPVAIAEERRSPDQDTAIEKAFVKGNLPEVDRRSE
jgi:hypothetical protein